MLDLIANFSKMNDGKFNDDLIYGIRKNDEMAKYIRMFFWWTNC